MSDSEHTHSSSPDTNLPETPAVDDSVSHIVENDEDRSPPEQPLIPVQLVPDHLLASKAFMGDGPRSSTAQQFIPALDTAKQDKVSRSERQEMRKRAVVRRKRRVQHQRATRSLESLSSFTRNVLLALVCIAPLAIGAVHMYTLLPIAVLSVVLLASTGALVGARKAPLHVGWFGVGLGVLTLWSWVQLLPLPHSFLALLSPQSAEWITFALGSLVPPLPTSSAISLFPRQSLLAALALTSAFCVFVASRNLERDRQEWLRSMWVFPALGSLLVVIGAVQRVLGTPHRLFFYTPFDQNAPPLFTSTFVNPNHVGALLALCAIASLGIFLGNRDARQRTVVSFAAALCGVGVLASCSLSAIIAFLFGLLAMGMLLIRHRMKRNTRAVWGSVLGLGALALIGFGVWVWSSPQLGVLRDLQKLPLLDPIPVLALGWDALWTSPLVGLGAGGFTDVANIIPPALPVQHNSVPNSTLQIILDYGLLVGLGALAACGTELGKLVTHRRWKPKDAPFFIGACAALLALIMESNMSSSAQLLGVTLPAVYLFSITLQRNALYERPKTPTEQSLRRDRWMPLVAALVLVTLSLPALLTYGRQEASSTSPSALLQHKLLQRPLDARAHLQGALDYARAQDHPHVLVALERAERFNPTDPAPLMVKARWLYAQGDRERAFSYWKRAASISRHLPPKGRAAVAMDIAQYFSSPELIVDALDNDPETWGPALERAINHRSSDDVLVLCRHLQKSTQKELHNLGVSYCALAYWKRSDVLRARALAESILHEKQTQDTLFVLLARIYTRLDEPDKALDVLSRAVKRFPRSAPVLLEQLEVLVQNIPQASTQRAEYFARLNATVSDLRPLVLRTPRYHGRFFFLTGQVLALRGQNSLAIRDFRRSIEASPDAPEPFLALSSLLKKERRSSEVRELYETFLTRFPEHPAASTVREALAKSSGGLGDTKVPTSSPER